MKNEWGRAVQGRAGQQAAVRQFELARLYLLGETNITNRQIMLHILILIMTGALINNLTVNNNKYRRIKNTFSHEIN
jgi:hypothetical protein